MGWDDGIEDSTPTEDYELPEEENGQGVEVVYEEDGELIEQMKQFDLPTSFGMNEEFDSEEEEEQEPVAPPSRGSLRGISRGRGRGRARGADRPRREQIGEMRRRRGM